MTRSTQSPNGSLRLGPNHPRKPQPDRAQGGANRHVLGGSTEDAITEALRKAAPGRLNW